jgi:nucleoid DNA-binding protein
MNHSETIQAIAQRLPHRTKREVAEILEVMEEVWLDELLKPGGSVQVAGLGRVSIEVRDIRSAGAVRQTLFEKHGSAARLTVRRLYVRFRPSAALRAAVDAVCDHQEEKHGTE